MSDSFSDGDRLVGLRKTSLVDYPGKVAAVIFFPFCNMRCPWCHNGDLILDEDDIEGVIPLNEGLIPLGEAVSHIKKRRFLLGGVVLSGGEPSLYRHLAELIASVKRLGLPVKLDTNGTRPDILKKIMSKPETRPDYIAMDLKVSPLRYAELMKTPPPAGCEAKIAGNIEKSAAIIRESGVEHEFRSLLLPSPFFTEADMEALRPLARSSAWNFKELSRGNCLDSSWNSADVAAGRA
jgi:pyruvate formate lyase activating enzyme